MYFTRRIFFVGIVFTLLFGAGILDGSPLFPAEHGPYFSFSYAPKGYGSMLLPNADGSDGTDITGPPASDTLSSASRLNLCGGYYYGIFQADLMYDSTEYQNQFSEDDQVNNGNVFGGTRSEVRFRAGKRFSHPGDTSWQFLYLGFSRMNMTADINNIDLTAYGFLAGFNVFYSWGISTGIEFVFTGDLHLGNFAWYSFDSDIAYTDLTKRYSLSAGGSLGAGLQYEPYNITLILKYTSKADILSLNAETAGTSQSFSCGSQGNSLGIEMLYVLPSVSYNRLPEDRQ